MLSVVQGQNQENQMIFHVSKKLEKYFFHVCLETKNFFTVKFTGIYSWKKVFEIDIFNDVWRE